MTSWRCLITDWSSAYLIKTTWTFDPKPLPSYPRIRNRIVSVPSYLKWLSCFKKKRQQECIPVGCVPFTSVAFSPATYPPHHACPLPSMPPTMHAPDMHTPCHACPPTIDTSPCNAYPPVTCTPCHACPPPVDRQTPVKNITFPNFVCRW